MLDKLTGNLNSSVKVSDLNKVIEAINSLEKRISELKVEAPLAQAIKDSTSEEKKKLWKTLKELDVS